MKKKWLYVLLICALSVAVLAGCANSSNTQAVNDSAVIEATSLVQESTDIDSVENATVNSDQEYMEVTFDESDEKTEYASLSENINLSDYEANSVVNITAAGEYILSGTLTNGQVVVDVGDEEVQLYLNNVEISNNSGSAILVYLIY